MSVHKANIMFPSVLIYSLVSQIPGSTIHLLTSNEYWLEITLDERYMYAGGTPLLVDVSAPQSSSSESWSLQWPLLTITVALQVHTPS